MGERRCRPPTEEGAFLAGALAALITTSDLALANDKRAIGFIGGLAEAGVGLAANENFDAIVPAEFVDQIQELIEQVESSALVHQHLMLAPDLTVAENIVLGTEPRRARMFLDRDLPVGTRQRVEILKTLFRRVELLILDEPTAVLTPQESEILFRTLDVLRADGKTVLFISHKLDEVMRVAEHVTIYEEYVRRRYARCGRLVSGRYSAAHGWSGDRLWSPCRQPEQGRSPCYRGEPAVFHH